MASTPPPATFPVPPPVPRLQIVDDNKFPTPSFQEWCQFMWAAIQGGGGIVPQTTDLEKLFALAYTRPSVASSNTVITGNTASVRGTYYNLTITNGGTPATQVAVSCDEVVLENNTGTTYKATSVSLTVSTAASGVNGLDTGAIAASTFYSVWVIYSGTTVAGLISLSPTAPTLPGGYTYSARIGWVLTDVASNLKNITQRGDEARYVGAGLPVMDSGAKGAPATPTWQAIAVAAYIPTTASHIYINVVCGTANAVLIAAPNNSYGAYNTITNTPPIGITSSAGAAYDARQGCFLLESTNIYWASAQASNAVTCYGWRDNLS